ncbi:MAG: hypothetical protein GT601_01105 [Acidaminobacter sp.]|uniref:hypothetical protein n=1 Tax=Acidaminobacter sp. TaxID=1872102 RepID=UPI0013817749|nr:hypothetical protein [Acidaminobacter sp.]MZQ96248.1 hypothetical protein [Acidaminobacter sp.]
MKLFDLLDSLLQTIQGVRMFKLIAFLVIAAVIILVTAPAVGSFVDEVEGFVCECNRKMIATHYTLYLQEEKLIHNDLVFAQFLGAANQDYCPKHGDITYSEGKICCSAHPDRGVEMEPTIENEMPWIMKTWTRCVWQGSEKTGCLNGYGGSVYKTD